MVLVLDVEGLEVDDVELDVVLVLDVVGLEVDDVEFEIVLVSDVVGLEVDDVELRRKVSARGGTYMCLHTCILP